MSAGSAADVDCVIVGAGIAGLAAAAELARAGRRTVVLEKSRGLGGRMASRRIGAAVCDHGAQFFTVRTRSFHDMVAAAEAAGTVRRWCEGFARLAGPDAVVGTPGDGHARYRGVRAMTDLPTWIASGLPADLVDVRLATRAAAVRVEEHRVTVGLEEGGEVRARGLLLTTPVPQALDLLGAGGTLEAFDGAALATLRTVSYDPCFALMLVLDRPSLVPEPGGIQFEGGPISWVGDNQRKGISPVPALTVHASGAWSRERFDVDGALVSGELEALASRWFEPGSVVERSLARWKFAQPVAIVPAPFVAASTTPPVACCGDAFDGPRVEGAAGSGRAAGDWMAGILRAGHGPPSAPCRGPAAPSTLASPPGRGG